MSFSLPLSRPCSLSWVLLILLTKMAKVLALGRLWSYSLDDLASSTTADGGTPLRSSCNPHLAPAQEVSFGAFHSNRCLNNFQVRILAIVEIYQTSMETQDSWGKLNLFLSITFIYLMYCPPLRERSDEACISTVCSSTSH